MSEAAPEYPLHAAAEHGDTDALNHLLSEGVGVDARDDEGATPLMRAAKAGQVVAAHHLLKCGATIDALTPTCTTALMAAVRGGHAEVVRLLLTRGADPNLLVTPPPAMPEQKEQMRQLLRALGREKEDCLDERDRKPYRISQRILVSAFRSGSADTVKALLEGGVEVNPPPGESGMTPLHFAIHFSDIEIIRLLIEHNADVNGAGDDGITPLMSASMQGRHDIARLLLESGADVKGKLESPLTFAIVRNDAEMVKLLLEYGTSPTSEEGQIPASFMARNRPEIDNLLKAHEGIDWHDDVKAGDGEAVRTRLDSGARINVRNDRQETALMLAVEGGNVEMARLLLDRGADVSAKSQHGRDALMRAAVKDDAEMVSLLIDRGADITAEDEWGQTSLYLAAQGKRIVNIARLTQAGARLSIVEAALLEDRARVTAFLANGTPVDYRNEAGVTTLMAASLQGNEELVRDLLERGADVGARDKQGKTPFLYAAGSQKDKALAVMEILLAKGAEIHDGTHLGTTALELAIMKGDESLARFLLSRGADPNFAPQSRVGPPIKRALMMCKIGRGNLTVLRLLLEQGADVNATGFSGLTPLMEAVRLDASLDASKDISADFIDSLIRLLIESGADVNAANGLGTVLDHAALAGNLEAVRLLLDTGADPNRTDGRFSTLYRAKMHGHQEIVTLLQERGAVSREPDIFPDGFLAKLREAVKQPDFGDKMREAWNRVIEKRKTPSEKAE